MGDPLLSFSDKAFKIELPQGICSPSPPAVFDGLAYIASTNGSVVSISDSKIEKQYRGTGEMTGTPAVNDHLIVVASSAKFIFVFDRNSEKLLWKFKTKKPITNSPIIADNSIFFGTTEGKLFALDTLGKVRWSSDVKTSVMSPSYDSGIVYIGTQNGTAAAFGASSGKLIWKSDAAGRTPCVGSDMIFYENRNGAVVALDKKNGSERWRYDADISASAFEMAASNTTLAYAHDDMLIVLDPETGKKQWDVHFKQPLCGSPMIVSTAVYVPCSDWNLYAYDLATGMELAHTDIGFAPWGSPSYGNGKIYFPNKQTLYILLPQE
ncbi:MAG TPA: PQQ-binding-like beta-propeller repeat protein [Candidatus Kapabacteria bacterium]|nr:PQQ-binding-like beta-propeller repeat protein [Candidatus Kapabacteria bacterium]